MKSNHSEIDKLVSTLISCNKLHVTEVKTLSPMKRFNKLFKSYKGSVI